jgi:polysaccharide pyruvyl transferase WcaK-like protein
MMSTRGARFLVLGGDADHNIGDRATLSALVQCLATHDASAEIAIVGRPGVGEPIPGVARIVRRGPRGFAGLVRTAFNAECVLLAGGGLFQDDDSRAKTPYWAARIGLLRALNSRLIGHSIGAGPLHHVDSRVAALIACAGLARISVRDRFARDTLAGCTSRPIDIVPDPAFMLDPAPREAATALLRDIGLNPGQPMIVATVRRWYHARGGFVPDVTRIKAGIAVKRDDYRFASLLDAIADGLGQLARRLDAGVLLMPGYNVAHEADDGACESLVLRLNGTAARIARIPDPRLYKAVVGQASLVVSARMRPLIFAAGMGVPFVGLSYNPKFDGLFELLGLEARPLPLDDFPDRWNARSLVAEAEAALNAKVDLRQRAAALAANVRRHTLAAAFGESASWGEAEA